MRPLCLQNVLYKWATATIYLMREDVVRFVTPHEQKAFRKSRFIFDHIWDVRGRWTANLYLKAYDTVNHVYLVAFFLHISHTADCPVDIHLQVPLYICCRKRYGTRSPGHPGAGVRQGDLLSPALCDGVLCACQNNPKCFLADQSPADDLLLYTPLPPHRGQGAVTRVVCPPGPPVYEDSCTAAWTSGPGGPRGREALGAPRGPSNRPPRHRGRQVQPRAAPPVPVQSGSADRPQSCVELGHPLPSAVVGDQRHVGRPGGGVSRPTTPPVGSVSGSPSLPTGAWSTRRHTSPHTQARRHLPPACATAGYGGGHQSGRP